MGPPTPSIVRNGEFAELQRGYEAQIGPAHDDLVIGRKRRWEELESAGRTVLRAVELRQFGQAYRLHWVE